MKDKVSMLIDTSGMGLHKRGYRRNSNSAPIKETLAASMCDLARIFPDTQLFDLFCGSGTILIEAALMAENRAPGLTRSFSAERGTVFSTYAVPKIAGEIRRFLRDDGAVKVPRTMKEQAALIKSARTALASQLFREPTLSELADHTGLSPEEIASRPPTTARIVYCR